MTAPRRADVCVVALAECFRGDGELFASPMGTIPTIGARLARATFEPDLVLTDGIATAVAGTLPLGGAPGDNGTVVEGWMPFRTVFDTLWWGRRHVVMGATQVDRRGNQNIACIGDWERPKAMLLGMRGAPGNTINHTTSYWVPKQSDRVFVEAVDFVSGLGYDRAAAVGGAARFHEIRAVVSDLGVFDFPAPDHTMRLVSVHPGVSVGDVVAATGFDLDVGEHAEVGVTRTPTAAEMDVIEEIDPGGLRYREVPDPEPQA
ncbi:MAG: CoA-transferase [Acidimicrobiia bacterium]|nr:CoA-transferase [Acidimicrobiia bacterium]